MGTFWELEMEYQLNSEFAKQLFPFPKVGKYLEKQQAKKKKITELGNIGKLK